MGPERLWNHWLRILPFTALVAVVVVGGSGFLHGWGWYLAFLGAGLVIGLPILDLDRWVASKWGTEADLFHRFYIFVLLAILALLMITSSKSMLGKGLVLSVLVHGAVGLTERTQRIIATAAVGGLVLLMLL